MAPAVATSSGISVTGDEVTQSRSHDRPTKSKKGTAETVVASEEVVRHEHPVNADVEAETLKLTDEENLVRGDVIIRDGHDVARYVVSTQDDGDQVLTFRSFIIGSGTDLAQFLLCTKWKGESNTKIRPNGTCGLYQPNVYFRGLHIAVVQALTLLLATFTSQWMYHSPPCKSTRTPSKSNSSQSQTNPKTAFFA